MNEGAMRTVGPIFLLFLLGGCTSAEDKARVRTAATAFEIAASAKTPQAEAAMNELKKAIDVVPDGKARDELLRCQGLLETYSLTLQTIEIATETNLLKIGHGVHSTMEDVNKAHAEAISKHPEPDPKGLVECELHTLPALTR
jgi:hypothetical protein